MTDYAGDSVADVFRQLETLRIAERFFDSGVLFALHEAGVLDVLADGPASLEQVRQRIDVDERILRATMDAGVALGILSGDERSYAAPDGVLDTLVRRHSPIYVGEFVRFLHSLMIPLSGVGQPLRGRPVDGSTDRGVAEAVARMDAAMDALSRSAVREFVSRVDFGKIRTFLDVGCGPGTYAFAVLDTHPEARATLLDLPEPLVLAHALATERGLTDRIEFVAGDALHFSTSDRYDAVLVSHILHMLGPDTAQTLLQRIRGMVAPGGRVVIQARFLDETRVSPRAAVLLNLVLGAITPEGRNHTIPETTAWLARAGFTNVRHVPFAVWNPSSCIVAEVPASA